MCGAASLLYGCGVDPAFELVSQTPAVVLAGRSRGVTGPLASASHGSALDDGALSLPPASRGLSGGWTAVTVQLDGVDLPDQIASMNVTGVSVEATAGPAHPGPVDLSFLKRIELYVLGTGPLPSFLLAGWTQSTASPASTATAPLELDVVQSVELKPYFERGLRVYLFVQGNAPPYDVGLWLRIRLRVVPTSG